jgi:hypothetical protein
VVLWLASQVFEDAMLPELLHHGPVLDLAVLDWVAHGIGLGNGKSLITNEEVQIIDALGGTLGTCWRGRGGGLGAGGSWGFLHTDLAGNDVVGFTVAGISHLGVTAQRYTHARTNKQPTYTH